MAIQATKATKEKMAIQAPKAQTAGQAKTAGQAQTASQAKAAHHWAACRAAIGKAVVGRAVGKAPMYQTFWLRRYLVAMAWAPLLARAALRWLTIP